MNDTIGDTLNRIKTAGAAGKETISVPFSNIIANILEVLQTEGFIKGFTKKGKKVIKTIDVELMYVDGKPRINGTERISRPSRRMYGKASELTTVRQGYGALVLSTPKGILTDKDARTQKVGGELLFKIW